MERRQRFEEILGAARSTFAARGYHATSVSDIVKASGVARGTFYLYFEGKRAVFDALLDRFVDAISERVHVVRVGPGQPPPYEQLRGNVRRVFDLLLEQREIAVILLDHAVGLDESADAKLRDFEDAMTDLLRRALGSGERLGLVETGNHELAARVILGAIKEVVRHYVVAQRAGLTPDEIVDQVIALCLRGVVGGPIDPLLRPLPANDNAGGH
jgi:AcrR family transcriptional regulator